VFLVIIYQYFLSVGLADYILYHSSTDRNEENLFHQNKEGIVSVIGYVALFFIAAQIGTWIQKTRKSLKEWHSFVLNLGLLDVLLWGLLILCKVFVDYSRRMVNLSYILCIVAINVQIITCSLIVCLITRPKTNSIISAINFNGIATFLLVCEFFVNLFYRLMCLLAW